MCVGFGGCGVEWGGVGVFVSFRFLFYINFLHLT